jgi:hypothetical protein
MTRCPESIYAADSGLYHFVELDYAYRFELIEQECRALGLRVLSLSLIEGELEDELCSKISLALGMFESRRWDAIIDYLQDLAESESGLTLFFRFNNTNCSGLVANIIEMTSYCCRSWILKGKLFRVTFLPLL